MNGNSGFVMVAGLAGAAGVALSAVAAHTQTAHTGTAAQFLLFHAPLFLILGAVDAAPWRKRAGGLVLVGLLLFAGDLLVRDVAGSPLFPMAAPTGGITMILGWLLIALTGLPLTRRRP